MRACTSAPSPAFVGTVPPTGISITFGWVTPLAAYTSETPERTFLPTDMWPKKTLVSDACSSTSALIADAAVFGAGS